MGNKNQHTDDNVDSVVQLVHIFPNRCTADASMALSTHVVAEGHYDLLDLLGQLTSRGQNQGLAAVQLGVYLLQNGN